jgi:hypothetical protein
VKIVENGRFENRSIRGMIPALADARLGAVPNNGGRSGCAVGFLQQPVCDSLHIRDSRPEQFDAMIHRAVTRSRNPSLPESKNSGSRRGADSVAGARGSVGIRRTKRVCEWRQQARSRLCRAITSPHHSNQCKRIRAQIRSSLSLRQLVGCSGRPYA